MRFIIGRLNTLITNRSAGVVVELSPFIRYDISRIKMKASDVLTNSETGTNEAILACLS
jgi:hypothetical protein